MEAEIKNRIYELRQRLEEKYHNQEYYLQTQTRIELLEKLLDAMVSY